MLKSMTAYAFVEQNEDALTVTVEARTITAAISMPS
jgi:uncharacterized protein YicC (UPF0701 family)